MDPNNDYPPTESPEDQLGQIPQPQPQPHFQNQSQPPGSPEQPNNRQHSKSRKKVFIILSVFFSLLLAGGGIYMLLTSETGQSNSNRPDNYMEVKQLANDIAINDREITKDEQVVFTNYIQGPTINDAVDRYCEFLGWIFGSQFDNSGYIISERYPEYIDESGESTDFTVLKQIDNTARASIDCVSPTRPNGAGLSQDMLFVFEDGVWKIIEEDIGSGLTCERLDELNVPVELVDECYTDTSNFQLEPR